MEKNPKIVLLKGQLGYINAVKHGLQPGVPARVLSVSQLLSGCMDWLAVNDEQGCEKIVAAIVERLLYLEKKFSHELKILSDGSSNG